MFRSLSSEIIRGPCERKDTKDYEMSGCVTPSSSVKNADNVSRISTFVFLITLEIEGLLYLSH